MYIYIYTPKHGEFSIHSSQFDMKSLRRKTWWKYNFVEDEVSGQARVQHINNLDEACTNADDRIMIVQYRSGDCVMS